MGAATDARVLAVGHSHAFAGAIGEEVSVEQHCTGVRCGGITTLSAESHASDRQSTVRLQATAGQGPARVLIAATSTNTDPLVTIRTSGDSKSPAIAMQSFSKKKHESGIKIETGTGFHSGSGVVASGDSTFESGAVELKSSNSVHSGHVQLSASQLQVRGNTISARVGQSVQTGENLAVNSGGTIAISGKNIDITSGRAPGVSGTFSLASSAITTHIMQNLKHHAMANHCLEHGLSNAKCQSHAKALNKNSQMR